MLIYLRYSAIHLLDSILVVAKAAQGFSISEVEFRGGGAQTRSCILIQ